MPCQGQHFQWLACGLLVGGLGALESAARKIGKKRSGCYLTTLFGNVEITTAAPIEATPRKKRGWLPLLTVLFCISYGLMTMLIVEQGRTIDSQRDLIRELFKDSMALNNYKIKALREQRAAKGSQAPKNQSQDPSNSTTPSTQAQNQSPSSQAAPQHRTQNQKMMPNPFQHSFPASDQTQDRRALVRI